MVRSTPSLSAVLLVRCLALVGLGLSVWGYFSPWIAPRPAGLQLSAHDLVEWLTFVQTVQDGTFPVSRFDMSLPLALIAILAALTPALFLSGERSWRQLAVVLPCLGLAGVCSLLVLPPYPFVLTAYADPELQPQFWLAVSVIVAALPVSILAWRKPGWATVALCILSVGAVAASWRAYGLALAPIADVLTKTPGAGYGVVVCVLGAAGLFVCGVFTLWQSRKAGLPVN